MRSLVGILSTISLVMLLTDGFAQSIRRIDGSSIDAAQLDQQVQQRVKEI